MSNLLLRSLLMLLLFCSCRSGKEVYLFTSFREPATEGLKMLYSYDALHWKEINKTLLKPEAGSSKIMRDPSMIKGPDGTFHLVWTTGWKGDQGFGYSNSKDLVHWSEQQHINIMEHESTTVNVWAPELFYDEESKDFIIIWASTIPFRFPKGIEAEDNNHRMYFTTTKDFKTFSKAHLFLDPGFSVIDAVIAKREQDNYALVLKDNTRPNRNLKMAFSNKLLGPYTKASDPFTGEFIEGPTVVKVNDDWLIYYDVYKEKKYGAMKTKDFKSFTDISSDVSVPQGHKHGTIFKAKEKVLKELLKQDQ